MIIGITGSRDWSDYGIIADTLEGVKPEKIIVGISTPAGATPENTTGADRLATVWARRNGVPYEVILPRFMTDGVPYAVWHYHERNKKIVAACQILIAFWDGKSSGTKSTIAAAKKIGRPVIKKVA